MSSVTGKLSIKAALDYVGVADVEEVSSAINGTLAVLKLTGGTADGQADKMFSDTRTLAASATENLDLAGTALVDSLGAAFSIAELVALVVVADSGNTNSVIVGGHASAAASTMFGDATDTIVLKPGQFVALGAKAAGWGVTATTADLLKIANSGGTTGVTYTIVLIGRSV